MTTSDADLRQYVDIVRRLLNEQGAAAADPDSEKATAGLHKALAEAEVLTLAIETADLENSLSWLIATVSEIASVAPSLGFAVAAHYSACRVALDEGDAARAATIGTAGVLSGRATGVVPTVLSPAYVLLLDPSESSVRAKTSAIQRAPGSCSFSGLRGAGLCEVIGRAEDVDGELDADRAGAALRNYQILCAAVLLGIVESSIASTETYTAQRRQFGSALTSFAAVRAMLADMRVRRDRVRALLDGSVQPGVIDINWRSVTAESGRVAVSVALDAIQLHGGYGYIEEYPVARHLRDAMSVSARSGARRMALAQIAYGRLGSAQWEAAR